MGRVLASDLNVGFHKFSNRVLETVNGVKVKSVKHLVEIIETVIDEKTTKFIHFSFQHNVTMVLEIDLAIDGLAKIMKEHKIKYDRSPNLREDVDVQMDDPDAEKKEKKKNMTKLGTQSQGGKTVKIIDDLTMLFQEE